MGDTGYALMATMLAQQRVDMKERLKSRPPHYFGNPQQLQLGKDQNKMFQANLTELNKRFKFNSCTSCSNSLLYQCNNPGEQDFKLYPHHGVCVSPTQQSQQ